MIALLHGTLLEATASRALLDVGGVGFELGVSGTTAAALPAPGAEVRLFTRLQVREDALTLFGFATTEERALFDKLVAVSGVGAKLALAVLSTFTAAQLVALVLAEDAVGMARVPGVGKKTAQRLILELKGVFAKDRELAGISPEMPLAPRAAAAAPRALDDARSALLSMGFTPAEVDVALDGADEAARVEDLLAGALKRLGMEA